MLTGVVLTHNEAANIKACLQSLKFCDKLLVIDDNSTDSTVNIAKKMGAKVLTHSLNKDFSVARNFALNQADTGWVLFVDADEQVSPELAQEIKKALDVVDFKGYKIKRVDKMWGRILKFGDVGDVWLVRLGRRGAGSWSGMVHETWEIDGRIGLLKHHLLHNPHPDMPSFLRKINYYSTLKANEFWESHRHTNVFEIVLGPVWRFGVNYFFKLGFLDGIAGFVHAMVMAFYQFLVAGKLWLRYKGINDETP